MALIGGVGIDLIGPLTDPPVLLVGEAQYNERIKRSRKEKNSALIRFRASDRSKGGIGTPKTLRRGPSGSLLFLITTVRLSTCNSSSSFLVFTGFRVNFLMTV